MLMEERQGQRSLSKPLYKIEMGILKVIPMLLAGCYFLNTTLSYFNIDTPLFSYIGGMSLLPLLFVYLSSFVFRFCVYHRMFLYYIFVSDCISYYDLYIGIPVGNRELFVFNESIAGLFLFGILYLKFKVCKH